MIWVETESSNISKVGYYEGDLHVEFKSGAQYKYYAVPYDTYNSLLEAESVGRFINKEIKGKYIYEQTKEVPKKEEDEHARYTLE